jgi:hypothetical protein
MRHDHCSADFRRIASLRPLSLALLAGLLLSPLAGCGIKQPIEGRKDPYVPKQVNLAEPDLQRRTAFREPIVTRRDGLLFVTLPVRAASDQNLHLDYRYTFFDQNGQILEETGWLAHKTLVSRLWTEIRFNSIHQEAADFRVDLRYSRVQQH